MLDVTEAASKAIYCWPRRPTPYVLRIIREVMIRSYDGGAWPF